VNPTPPGLRIVTLGDVVPALWRNGGGSTRELFTWPPGPDWRLRISVADIDADGPFSPFPGVRRWFAVLEGAGVVLGLGGGARRCTPADAPVAFDGADAPACRLIDAPTRDLNLMARDGIAAALTVARAGSPWADDRPWRALYVDGTGAALRTPDGARHTLPAGALATGLPPGPVTLEVELVYTHVIFFL
jgi:environmental stress-induced protein Ves